MVYSVPTSATSHAACSVTKQSAAIAVSLKVSLLTNGGHIPGPTANGATFLVARLPSGWPWCLCCICGRRRDIQISGRPGRCLTRRRSCCLFSRGLLRFLWRSEVFRVVRRFCYTQCVRCFLSRLVVLHGIFRPSTVRCDRFQCPLTLGLIRTRLGRLGGSFNRLGPRCRQIRPCRMGARRRLCLTRRLRWPARVLRR